LIDQIGSAAQYGLDQGGGLLLELRSSIGCGIRQAGDELINLRL
jgi:hypothetical protein